MRLSSIVVPLACLGAVVNAALGTVEFNLVFPRDDVAYAPVPRLPIIFSVTNTQAAQHMKVSFLIQTERPNGETITMAPIGGLTWGNWAANETGFLYSLIDVETYNFTKEGSRPLKFFASWMTCADGPNGHGESDSDTGHNFSSTASIHFRTANDGQAVNLLDSRDTECPKAGLPGVRIAVDDTVKPVVDSSTDSVGLGKCVTVFTPAHDGSDVFSAPCSDKLKLPAGLVKQVSLSLEAIACVNIHNCPAISSLQALGTQTSTSAAASGTGTTTTTPTGAAQPAAATTTGASDPPKKNAAVRLAVGGTACLAAVFGVFGLLLA
jgi:hypothetical protein